MEVANIETVFHHGGRGGSSRSRLLFRKEILLCFTCLDQNWELLEVGYCIVNHEDKRNGVQLCHFNVREPFVSISVFIPNHDDLFYFTHFLKEFLNNSFICFHHKLRNKNSSLILCQILNFLCLFLSFQFLLSFLNNRGPTSTSSSFAAISISISVSVSIVSITISMISFIISTISVPSATSSSTSTATSASVFSTSTSPSTISITSISTIFVSTLIISLSSIMSIILGLLALMFFLR
mmetsp:Transcript_40472/g.52108  ORF Transcript_40472/g.52108 Transcript_40472/m.52108 type:complete len:238 (-) Transcript_40472:56-769(-)